MRSPRHPFVKIKPVDHRHSFSQDQASWSQTLLFVKTKLVGSRRSFLSRSSQLIANTLFSQSNQLIADVPLVKIKPVDRRHPFVKIKPVDRRRSFVKTKPIGHRYPFSSRSSQLIADSSIIKIKMKKSLQSYQLTRIISEFSN